MVYEDICNFGMDQLVITQYKKILKILQENSNILILKIPIEKVKSKETIHFILTTAEIIVYAFWSFMYSKKSCLNSKNP